MNAVLFLVLIIFIIYFYMLIKGLGLKNSAILILARKTIEPFLLSPLGTPLNLFLSIFTKKKPYSIEKLLKAQEMAIAGIIFAPSSFKKATRQQLLDSCDGCGARGSWFRPPAFIFFTWIGAACIVHDWMYSMGYTAEDKSEADRAMNNNMQRIFDRDAYKWYKPTILQYLIGAFYYLMVVLFGGRAFWDGKN